MTHKICSHTQTRAASVCMTRPIDLQWEGQLEEDVCDELHLAGTQARQPVCSPRPARQLLTYSPPETPSS